MNARGPMSKTLPRILLTGFDPFGGETVNPSWEAARALHGRRIGGHRVVARQIPTEFAASLRLLKAALRMVAAGVAQRYAAHERGRMVA